jgi:hypothetical protein
MKFHTGVTTVATAGTQVQVYDVSRRVKFVKFKALVGNSGLTYVGLATVASTTGYELSATNELEINYGELGGSEMANAFWVDSATNGDKVCWMMILD